MNGEEHRQHIAGSVAGALVVEAVGGGQAGPVGVAAAAHQGGHAVPVQRPGLAEVHKVQYHLLTCRTHHMPEYDVMCAKTMSDLHKRTNCPELCHVCQDMICQTL